MQINHKKGGQLPYQRKCGDDVGLGGGGTVLDNGYGGNPFERVSNRMGHKSYSNQLTI
jgi:hypothetical protein